jgi:hypothetical protein
MAGEDDAVRPAQAQLGAPGIDASQIGPSLPLMLISSSLAVGHGRLLCYFRA